MKKYGSKKRRAAGCVRVFLNTLNPPHLSSSADLHGLVRFIDEYETYVAVGGQIAMSCCIDGSLLLHLVAVEPFNASNQMEMRRALYKSYCPKHITVTSWWLQNEKCPRCDNMNTFIQGLYLRYVRRFCILMDICQRKLPSTENCLKILVRNTQPAELSNYLSDCSIQETPYESVMTSIERAVQEFETSRKVMEALRHQQSKRKIADHSQRPRRQVFSPDQPSTVPVANSSTTPLSYQPKRTWARDMCLGCGHITDPPHRRRDCPYRECQDWHAHGVPVAPIHIPPVARLIDGGDNDCSVHAEAYVVTNSNRASAENISPNRGSRAQSQLILCP
jgi:hypothetical protein